MKRVAVFGNAGGTSEDVTYFVIYFVTYFVIYFTLGSFACTGAAAALSMRT